MSLKQWIAVDRDCHPKPSQHSQTQPTTLANTSPVMEPEAPQPDSLQVETLQALAGSLPDGTALLLAEFRLHCLD